MRRRAAGAMAVAVAVAVAGFITADIDDAKASTCGHDGDAWVVPPPVNVKAPLNVRPRITLHADFRTRGFCPPWADPSVIKCPKTGTYDLELRESGRGGAAGAPIATTIRESRSNQVSTIEMIPKKQLAPNTRYEIRYFDTTTGTPIEIAGTFMTGTAIDTTPPTWAGLSGKFQRSGGLWPNETPPPPKKRTPGVITLDMTADCYGLGVEFNSSAQPTDDQTRSEDIRFAWWIGDADAPIDYDATLPLSYTKGNDAMFDSPSARIFKVVYGTRLEPLNDFSLPPSMATKKAFKFGARAVDLAGNMSKPSEVVVRIP